MKADIIFKVVGNEIPLKHAYPLYAALSTILGPDFHNGCDFGVFPIHGRPLSSGRLRITRDSRLRLRVPTEQIADFSRKLSCKKLDIAGYPVILGSFEVHPLNPSPSLISDLVTIRPMSPRHTHIKPTPEYMVASLKYACEKMGIAADVQVLERDGQAVCRTVKIKGQTIIGYAVKIDGLSPEHSVALQEAGLGGRRKLSCGLFRPTE